MNHEQRNSNRRNAWLLFENSRVCPECGERGFHFVSWEENVLLNGTGERGFWTCPELYGEDGRRIEQ